MFYFIIKQDDHSTIARSSMFDTDEQAERALVIFRQKIALLLKEIEHNKTAVVPTLQQQLEDSKPQHDIVPSRFSFRIDLYRSEDEQQLFGKIEYPLTKDKIHFKGLNGEKILNFIHSKLPNENIDNTRNIEISTLALPAPETQVENSSSATSSIDSLQTSPPKHCTILISKQLAINSTCEMQVLFIEPLKENYSLHIFAKSLQSRHYIEIQATKLTQLEHKTLIINFNTGVISLGLYRLTVTLLKVSKPHSSLYEGNCYVQIV
ncbi:MAG: hypothetical protein HC892_20645 [Saprospiraceae bacterium]|nr:hypothetical protein [Saprospiraceae bacterium]